MGYEQWLAAVCIWREARGESIASKTAIWHVIQNRAADPEHRWPRSISAVVAQHAQFSSMTAPGDPNLIQWPTSSPSADWNAFLDCQSVVQSPLNADPTEGSNMYHSEPAGQEPYWVKDATPTVTIGAIKFYKLN